MQSVVCLKNNNILILVHIFNTPGFTLQTCVVDLENNYQEDAKSLSLQFNNLLSYTEVKDMALNLFGYVKSFIYVYINLKFVCLYCIKDASLLFCCTTFEILQM